ncbi:MAG TPA: hypothetical protein ENI44_03225, partial [Thermoplasmatales archaeon]|nr:hypothetical protein [Thermoplasmatales archaeon]
MIIFVKIGAHAGLYAQVCKVARIEGGLEGSGKYELKPLKLVHQLSLYGGVYATVKVWFWEHKWSYGITWSSGWKHLDDEDFDYHEHDFSTFDLLCLQGLDEKILDEKSRDGYGIDVLSSNVVGNANPRIVLLDNGDGLAVWSDLVIINETSLQSDIYYATYQQGVGWSIPVHIETPDICEFNPEVLLVKDASGMEQVIICYQQINDTIGISSNVDTFYNNPSMMFAVWDPSSDWQNLNISFDVVGGAVNSHELCYINNSIFISYIVDSNPNPWENGIGNIYLRTLIRKGVYDNLSNPILIQVVDPLNGSCQPSVAFSKDNLGLLVYSIWNSSSKNNEILFSGTNNGVDFTEVPIYTSKHVIEHVTCNIMKNNSIMISWVDNSTSILSRFIIPDENISPADWIIGDIMTVYNGTSVTYMKPVFSNNSLFYLFQVGGEFIPYVIEYLDNNSWGNLRQISLDGLFSSGQLDGDSNDMESFIVYMSDTPVEDWMVGHWRLDAGYGNISYDSTRYENNGIINGLKPLDNSTVIWQEHKDTENDLPGEYGYYL